MTSSDYNNRGGMYVIKPWRCIKRHNSLKIMYLHVCAHLCAVSLFIEIQFVLKQNTQYVDTHMSSIHPHNYHQPHYSWTIIIIVLYNNYYNSNRYYCY